MQPINDIREKLIVMRLHNKLHGQCDAVFFYNQDEAFQALFVSVDGRELEKP